MNFLWNGSVRLRSFVPLHAELGLETQGSMNRRGLLAMKLMLWALYKLRRVLPGSLHNSRVPRFRRSRFEHFTETLEGSSPNMKDDAKKSATHSLFLAVPSRKSLRGTLR